MQKILVMEDKLWIFLGDETLVFFVSRSAANAVLARYRLDPDAGLICFNTKSGDRVHLRASSIAGLRLEKKKAKP